MKCALLFPPGPLNGPETIKLNDIIMFTDKRQAEKGKIPVTLGFSVKTRGSIHSIPLDVK
jgi:hypothetical protein